MQTVVKPAGKPRTLGPKQMAWCDEHLGNFEKYRKGVEQVIADTEASRKSHLKQEKKQ